jgi:two-component system alkaline phosphatase synthesis response regulator PhoP
VQVLTFKLRNAGYEVITAIDGEQGLEAATEHRPDLIITDYQMPYMTGLELCVALAAQEATRDIPVIILTARGYALGDRDLSVGNIKDVISKPFSPRSILRQVQTLLGETVSGGDEEATAA